MAAGYSGTPLPKKLGIKEGSRVRFEGAPSTFGKTLGKLPAGVRVASRLVPPLDIVHAFVTSRAKLEARLPALLAAVADGGALWLSWPKKASKVETDITEDVLREVVLPLGWVDVKVCAVDEVWSGLQFRKRRAR